MRQIQEVTGGTGPFLIDFDNENHAYYFHYKHQYTPNWMKNVFQAIESSEKHSLLGKLFTLYWVFRNSPPPRELIIAQVQNLPNLSTPLEKVFWLHMAGKISFISQDVIEKALNFMHGLPKELWEFRENLKLARYVTGCGSFSELRWYLNQVPVDYFLVSSLADRSNKMTQESHEIFDQYIRPLGKSDFDLYHLFFVKMKRKVDLPIYDYILNALKAMAQDDDWDQSVKVAQMISSEAFQYKVSGPSLWKSGMAPLFSKGDGWLRARLLPLYTELGSNPDENFVKSLVAMDGEALPYPELVLYFQFLLGSQTLQKSCGQRALEVLEALIRRSESAKSDEHAIKRYNSIHLGSISNNIEKWAFKDKDSFLKFCHKHKKFMRASEGRIQCRHIFPSLKDYVESLAEILGKDATMNMLRSQLEYRGRRGRDLSDDDIKGLGILYKKGVQWKPAHYGNLLTTFPDLDHLERVFVDAPEILKPIKQNMELTEALEPFLWNQGAPEPFVLN